MIVPVILSGGAGTRLWPVSRKLHPKPFIRLADGESLLQKALIRATALPGVPEVLIVTNQELYSKTKAEFHGVGGIGTIPISFILEPFGRNTAAAIAIVAAHTVQAYGEDISLLILPADHLVTDLAAFVRAVSLAEQLAKENNLVVFGCLPTAPEIGYGYIEADFGPSFRQDKTGGLAEQSFPVLRFTEKPSLERAATYVASGRYLWNTGMLCFRAGTLIEEMNLHAPEIFTTALKCFSASHHTKDGHISRMNLDAISFQQMPDISIDYAIMEKSARLAVVGCDIGWSDIGTWSAVSGLMEPDSSGNCIHGEILLHDASNCYIQAENRVIGAVGVNNLIVIDTPDALLVADKHHVQDVKHIVGKLKKNKHYACDTHQAVSRPWGKYTVLEEGHRFKIKRIMVNPGASLSLQMHYHRSEHWVVVSGAAKVINGEAEFLINVNESTFIPAGHKHRLENPGMVDLVIIEVQSGDYLSEDDIVRFEDQYGRGNNSQAI